MEKYPKWIEYLVKLARPGSLIAMFSLLVFGSLLFAVVEFFSPGSGARASEVFTETLRSFPEAFYDTLQWMFAAYVAGRSGQEIAKKVMNGKLTKSDSEAG